MARIVTLSPLNVQKLKDHQRQMHDIIAEYDRLEECGADCQAEKALAAEKVRQIGKMLENFGPPQ